jgi:hypothetical protein
MLQRGSPGAALTAQARDAPESAPRRLHLPPQAAGRRGALVKSHPAGLRAGPAFSRRSHPLSPPGGPLTGNGDPASGCSARERVRQMIRWRRRPSAPIVMSITTFSSNCSAEPQASVQRARRAASRDAVAIGHAGAAVPPPTRSDRRQLGWLTPIAGFRLSIRWSRGLFLTRSR